MAEVTLKVNIDTSASGQSMAALETKLTSLKEQLKNVDIGSAAFKKLQTEIKQADAKLQNVNKSLEGMSTERLQESFGRFAGGVSQAFGAVILLGGKGNKTLEEMQKNLNVAMGVVMGVRGAVDMWTGATKLAKAAQDALGAAMKSNPWGLVATAIAAAAVALIAYSSKLSATTTLENSRISAISEMNKSTVSQIAKINILKTTIENVNVSEANRLRAARELNTLTGGNIKITDLSSGSLKNLDEQTKIYISTLRQRAQAEAVQGQITKLMSENLDLVAEKQKNVNEIENKTWAQMQAIGLLSPAFMISKYSKDKAGYTKYLNDKLQITIDANQKEIESYLKMSSVLEPKVDKNKEEADANSEIEKAKTVAQKKRDAEVKVYTDMFLEKRKALDDDLNKQVADAIKLQEQIAEVYRNKSENDPIELPITLTVDKSKTDALTKEIEDKTVSGAKEVSKELSTIKENASLADLENEKVRIENDYADKLISYEDYENALNEIAQTESDVRKEIRKAEADASLQLMNEISNTIFENLNNNSQRALDNTLAKAQTSYDTGVEYYKSQLDQNLMTQEAYDASVEALDKQKQEKEKAAKTEAAKKQKEYAIWQAVINTAAAVISAAATGGPAWIVTAALAAALGAVEIANIVAQPIPEFGRGGNIDGPSHNTGGVNVNAEGGEMIINKNSARMFGPQLSTMNMLGGGVALAPTSAPIGSGITTAEVRAIVKETVNGIRAIPVQNNAMDTISKYREVENIQNRARL